MQTKVKTPAEIDAMRKGGRMLAAVLQVLKASLQPGMSTQDLDDIAVREIEALGAKSAILGYQGFPKSICISINNEVVHGIPRADRIIQAGDIVGMDFCVLYKGMITDAAISAIAGNPRSQAHSKLLAYTERALIAGIAEVHNKVRTGDIGAAVEAVLKKQGYGIVRDMVGHGVGHQMHEDPNVPNYGRANTGPWLEAGMTIAIEPMATLGTDRVVLEDDNWTISTADGSLSAHFEHTVLITEDGAEILTTLHA